MASRTGRAAASPPTDRELLALQFAARAYTLEQIAALAGASDQG